MKRALLVASIAAISSVNFAFAEENKSSSSSKVKIEDVNPEKNKTKGEDVDEVITNQKMRAESGSKSKYSIATTWSYRGGSVEKPLDESRPNITLGSDNTEKAFLAADINGKYNIDQRHSIFAGIGTRWITPLYGNSVPDGFDRKFDANDPSVSFRYHYKALGFQNSLATAVQFYTAQDRRAVGNVNDFIISQNSMYQIGTSRLSLGLSLSSEFQTFDKGPSDRDESVPGPLGRYQSDFRFGVVPVAEYQLTDKVNLRTLIGNYFEHSRLMDAWTFRKNKVYQSVGVGISVTRDLYLYPNVQFIPDQLRPSQTNVALTANINIF